jgi:6-phosphofructokinase 2
MTSIVTLTMNPALDVSTSVATVMPGHKLRCATPRFDPGGGGINVARTITALGGEALALFPAGGAAGERIEHLLAAQAVPHRALPIAGATRESMTVADRGNGDQYRFVLPGPALAPLERQSCLAAIVRLAPRPRWIVASGSLPPGAGDDFYAILAHFCRANDIHMVLDTSGPALAACRGARLYLVKPSLTELAGLVGHALDDEAAEIEAARHARAAGLADTVVVSLGARGALLATAGGTWRLPGVAIAARSAVGAGDAMVAAIVLALDRGRPLLDAARYGVAAGAAALLAPGTQTARASDVESLFIRSPWPPPPAGDSHPVAKGAIVPC